MAMPQCQKSRNFHLETNTSELPSMPHGRAFSAYARAQLAARPNLTATLARLSQQKLDAAGIANLIGDALTTHAGDLPRALRDARRVVMLVTMERDLAGLADLSEVTQAMSALAEQAIGTALAAAVAELTPRLGTPIGTESGLPQTLHVVGMGKLGGLELNVSSDIDLIFLYPEEGETRGGTVSVGNQEFFGQVGKRLIATLSDVTAEGYVFRVDMRLRPWGDGPLAMGFEALEDYLVAQGRDWERYAWIKGRALTGDRTGELMAMVTPFVYRRYLDFGSIESLKGLHAQIRREVARRELDDHVKLGPGGIREIEFVAQALQLIRAGRDTRLRLRPTVPTLNVLAELGLLPAPAVRELTAAYDFLRRVEHRLQYAEDQQTHMLPASQEARSRLAQAMGCSDWPGFMSLLDTHRGAVRRHFEQVLGDPAPVLPGNYGVTLAQRLQGAGFVQPEEQSRLIDATVGGAKIRRLADTSRERFDTLLPRLIDSAGGTPSPDVTLPRLLGFIESIASRASYLSLLSQSAPALTRLARLFGASDWAYRYLTLHPILLDELIDERTLYAAPDMAGFTTEGQAQIAACGDDLEAQMNALRETHHTAVFRLLAQDIQGLSTVETLADHLSELADRTLAIALAQSWAALKSRHRDTPEFAVIAYGKLGGKELGYASDLDLIFIYDDDHEKAAETYARLAQRLITFIDTQTTAGRLFEVDTRLRPDGASGLLVTSLAAFSDYQRRRAWVWEHQALTRARFCAGSARVGAAFEEERRHILALPREADKLRAEVRAMREKMHAGHPNRSDQFDLKHDTGGMVDIEFCVQTLVLLHARERPRLFGNLGNISLLREAGSTGLIPVELGTAAGDAYRTYRRYQHALRLNNAEYARVPHAQVSAETAVVSRLWQAVLGNHASAG